jgi:hypothetical protein
VLALVDKPSGNTGAGDAWDRLAASAAGEPGVVDGPLGGAAAGDSLAACDQSVGISATRARFSAPVAGAVLVAAAAGSVTVVAATASAAGSAAASGLPWRS